MAHKPIELDSLKSYRQMIDVGANVECGDNYIDSGLFHGFQEIHAFEPALRPFNYIVERYGDNPSVFAYNIALTDKECIVEMECKHRKNNGGGWMAQSLRGDKRAAIHSCKTPGKPLDSYNFQEVDFIKIDCDFSDDFVLLGAKETLLRCKPLLFVEAAGPSNKPCREILKELGFVIPSHCGNRKEDLTYVWGD